MAGRAMSRRLAAPIVSVLALPLFVGPAAPAQAKPASAATSPTAMAPVARPMSGKSLSSRLARTDETLLNRRDSAPVRVMVKLDYDPVATYRGGVAGLAPTSPAVTGEPLNGGAAERRYETYLSGREQRFASVLG